MDRRHRLTSSLDFARVIKRGTRASAGPVAIVVLPTGEQRDPRIGVAANKAVGSAVRRNRAKRILREAARALLPRIKPGHDVVLIAKPGCPDSSFQEVLGALSTALDRADAVEEAGATC